MYTLTLAKYSGMFINKLPRNLCGFRLQINKDIYLMLL